MLAMLIVGCVTIIFVVLMSLKVAMKEIKYAMRWRTDYGNEM